MNKKTNKKFNLKSFTIIMMLNLFCIGQFPSIVVAEEPSESGLSLNNAINMALKNSETITKAEQEVEKKEEWRNYRAEQLDFVPLEYSGTAYVEIPWGRILTSDLEWRMSKKSLTTEQDKVVMSTCNKYWDILKAQEKTKVAEKSKESARKQLQNSRAAYQVGIISKATLIGAEAQYEAANATLQAVQNDLDKLWFNFNQSIGVQPEARIKLIDEIVYKPLEVTNLNYEVTKVLENAPAVWQAEEMITMQNYLAEMMFYTGEYTPYKARQIEEQHAIQDAATIKKSFEKATRDIYYGIKSLEEAYAGAQERIKVAEESLRVKKLMHEVGMATATDVLSAEKDLADANYAAFDIACQHTYLKLAFEKPWAMQ